MAMLFSAYASKPEVNREALYNAGRAIAGTGEIEVKSWEDLLVGGRVIVRRILEAIKEATVCAFDISTVNENVLFELGYAIAIQKPVWLFLDKTDADARQRWKQFQLLSGVGYVGWQNAEDIKVAFLRDRPDHTVRPLYRDLIEPHLMPAEPGAILYLPSYNRTEPARQIGRRLDEEARKGIRVLVADPTESSLNSLGWYAAKAYETACSILHFDAPRRELASLHNPRSALVAGLACGLERPVLMLAEEDYSPPLDYQDILRVYTSARECVAIVDAWLRGMGLQPRTARRLQRVKLATELRTLRFGEPVAENEIDTLSDYFVRTAAFDDVISERNALFVGRKGTGKTANMYQAAASLAEDARNLVVVVKPASYEFASLVSMLRSLSPSLQQYFIEGLWKFLLQSEIANAVVKAVEGRIPGIPYTDEEKRLIDFVDSTNFGLRDDFAARFERTVAALTALDVYADTTEASRRDHLNEALHARAIARLRSLLGQILRGRRRVAVLIDNLDKGWERGADLPVLARLLLGLLSAIGRVRTDFDKDDSWRARISLTVATFLRSDIYAYVRSIAREPDKLPISVIDWRDSDVLLRVLEERFLAARPEGTEPEELWTRFFCPAVSGIATRQYLTEHSLPRPRDFIYFCNAAAIAAVNRGHDRIEEQDVLTGERSYSQFALEALLVENGITVTQFKRALQEFLGEPAVMTEDQAIALLRAAEIPESALESVLDRLKTVGFLGVETAPARFEFPESAEACERAGVLARKVAMARGARPLLAIHKAYWSYLEIRDAPAAT
jgi:hypothetical protein